MPDGMDRAHAGGALRNGRGDRHEHDEPEAGRRIGGGFPDRIHVQLRAAQHRHAVAADGHGVRGMDGDRHRRLGVGRHFVLRGIPRLAAHVVHGDGHLCRCRIEGGGVNDCRNPCLPDRQCCAGLFLLAGRGHELTVAINTSMWTGHFAKTSGQRCVSMSNCCSRNATIY